MNASEPSTSLVAFSPITEMARRAFHAAKALSPMNWLRKYFPLLKPRSDILPDEVLSDEFTRRRAKAVDIYILAWLCIEGVIMATVCLLRLSPAIGFVLGLLVAVRIIEIVQVTVNTVVFDSLSGRPDNRVASSARMVILALVSFIELCACFGVIYAADYTRLKGAGRAATAFYFSVITQLTIGYGDVYPTGYMRLVAAIQGIVSFVFIVLVFARIVSILPRVETLLEPSRTDAAGRQHVQPAGNSQSGNRNG